MQTLLKDKTHTHSPILVGSALESALESADSNSKSADCKAGAAVGM